MLRNIQNEVYMRNLEKILTAEQLLPLYEKMLEIRQSSLIKAQKQLMKKKQKITNIDKSHIVIKMYDRFFLVNEGIEIETITANIKKQ